MFSSRGLKGTSIAAVAERVGLSDAGVLHHFPTKATLIEAVLDRGVQEQTRQMQQLVEPGGLSAIEQMATWGSVIEQTPELVSLQIIMSTEGISTESAAHDYVVRRYQNVHELIVGLIRQGIERGEIRPDVDAEWEASALIAYLDGIRLQWFYTNRQLPIASHVRQYFSLLINRLTS